MKLLPNSYPKAVKAVNVLYDDTFLDYQTRAFFVEWLVYNVPTGNLIFHAFNNVRVVIDEPQIQHRV